MFLCYSGCRVLSICNKRVILFKSSLALKIDLPIYTNITTILKWKLFTKVIKRPYEETWVWIDRVSN